MFRFLIAVCLVLFPFTTQAQKLQGALKVTAGKTFLNEKNAYYDPLQFKVEGLISPGFGVQLNYRLSESFELSSGLGMQYKRLLLTQEKIPFKDIAGGSTYIRTRFSAIELPLMLRYKIPVGMRSLIIPSAGVVVNSVKVNLTAIGYDDIRYVGQDSLHYDIKGGGSMVSRFSCDPYFSLGYELQKDGYKVVGVNVFYQYALTPIPQIDFYSEFFNSSAYTLSRAVLNGNLSYAGVTLLYYPSFLTFRKIEDEDAFEEEWK